MLDDIGDIILERPAITSTATEDARAAEGGGPNAASRPVASIERPAYPAPAAVPTQQGPNGIKFDFNDGARIFLPLRETGQWRLCLKDLDTGNLLFETLTKGALVRSTKRFYVRFGIEVWDESENGPSTLVMANEFDAYDRPVLIQFPVGTLGDSLAWFPYVVRFWQVHGCRVTLATSEAIIALLRKSYPQIGFATHEAVTAQNLAAASYATYNIGLYFDDAAFVHQPVDFRHVGLHRTAAHILGVDPAEEAPRLVLADASRPIEDPYVCIGVQSSSQSKYWNNPFGWHKVIAFLKARGFRVVCIDREPVHGTGIVYNHIPHGAEDQTGDRPLLERARWLRHAAAFIGLSSGLSWLAWAAGTPVVMISGFTLPNNEFDNPFRVINWHACNGCWNDVRQRFDHKDFLWCPRHAGTPRQFECTRLITAEQVISTLKRVPSLSPLNHDS